MKKVGALVVFVVLVVVLVLVWGCAEKKPTPTPVTLEVGLKPEPTSAPVEPSPVATKVHLAYPVVLWEHPHGEGRKVELFEDCEDLKEFTFGGITSAVEVPQGVELVLYVQEGFQGEGITLSSGWHELVLYHLESLLTWDNKAFSVAARAVSSQAELETEVVSLYEDPGVDFQGEGLMMFFPEEGRYNLWDLNFGRKASVVKVPASMKVVCYSGKDTLPLGPGIHVLRSYEFGPSSSWEDKIDEIEVVRVK